MALVPVVNDKVPVIGGVSAEVERSEIVLPARDGVSAAAEKNMVPDSVDTARDGVSPAAETNMVPESVDTVSAAMQISCWDKISRPVIGLGKGEKMMHGGALDGLVLLNGLESSGFAPNEIVLRGGRVKKPSIVSDLIVKKTPNHVGQKQRCIVRVPHGQRPWKSPLKHVHVFEEMQKVMVRHCDQRMVDS